MRMLMPSHAKNVKLYKDTQPIFTRYGIESQLDAMFSPIVQLRSGGYIVHQPDRGAGRDRRQFGPRDARASHRGHRAQDQPRSGRGNRAPAPPARPRRPDRHRLHRHGREAQQPHGRAAAEGSLKHDRARIQVGRISHFGLMEMSRQRIRTSVLESSTEKCPYCGGTGHVRSVSSVALQLLRAIEEQLMKGATHNLIVRTRPDVALYVLNQKRAHLRALEERLPITITINADETRDRAAGLHHRSRRAGAYARGGARRRAERTEAQAAAPLEDEDDLEEAGALESDDAEAVAADDGAEQGEAGGRRRRRRRRRGRNGGETPLHVQPHRHEGAAEDFDAAPVEAEAEPAENGELIEQPGELAGEQRGEPQRDGERRRRRRGRRGGRRNRLEREGEPAEPNDQRPPGREQQHFSPMGESPPPTVSDAEPEGVVDTTMASMRSPTTTSMSPSSSFSSSTSIVASPFPPTSTNATSGPMATNLAPSRVCPVASASL